MGNYIVNHSLAGLDTIEIEETYKLTPSDKIVVVLDGTVDNKLKDYYEACRNLMTNNISLFLIMVEQESKIRKVICNLLASYRNYNIYKVDSKISINKEYINTMFDREPTIDEVQQYIGGDISSYSDINILLLGIDELVGIGDIEGLKRFIEEHLDSIESLTGTVDYMKRVVDNSNGKELLDRIEELKSKIKDANSKIDKLESENDDIKNDNIKLQESNDMAKKELARLMSKNKEMEQQMSSSAPVIQTYSEINTSLIKCKATSVIYFKEISYVQYTNSMVTILVKMLGIMRKKVKLIIYDNKVGLANIYKPLSVIGGSEFVANKSNFISGIETFVVVEPNPTILTSILESVNPTFDVVIVYDRMRQATNIVNGNNVVKFYIMNSAKEFKEVSNQLRITDKTSIITRTDSSIGPECLNIPKIPEYSAAGTTDSARISKYKKLQCAVNNKQLIQTILDRARI